MKPTHTCRNLRTKKMFIPSMGDEALAHETEALGHSSHCWCNCTLTETGPDDRPVGGEICKTARSCFEE